MIEFPVVHAVTDSSVVLADGFVDRAGAIMHALGPRGALHLRTSRASSREFYDIAMSLTRMQDETGCWLIVNDRADIAAAVNANGLQLASHSLTLPEARTISPGRPVGTSVHSVEEAIAAQEEGASWCVAGTVFATPSHVGRAPAKIEFIERVAAAVTIPVIAIGGISPEDVPALRRAGAHGIATIRGAGWDHGTEVSAETRSLMETRLFPAVTSALSEPVRRYISAYDSESGSGRDDNADGQRRSPGAGAE